AVPRERGRRRRRRRRTVGLPHRPVGAAGGLAVLRGGLRSAARALVRASEQGYNAEQCPSDLARRKPMSSDDRLDEPLPPVPPVPATDPILSRDNPCDAPAAVSPPVPRCDVPASARVPGYEILGVLGRGGMGVVYKARQVGLNRVVALKMILTGDQAGLAETARFQAEAEAVARLQHPGIVAIHEVGVHEGRPYLSMEFCSGGSLEKKLAGKPLPPEEAAALVQKLTEGVQAAHDARVIHRDLKPANVLLSG